MKTILCPIDFSSPSLNALEFAAGLCSKYKFNLSLLHVVISSRALLEQDTRVLVGKLKALAEETRKSFPQIPDVSSEMTDHPEEPGKGIIRTCDDGGYDMIIMGTNGVADVEEAFFGSNSARVIKESRIPVMTIPENVKFKGFRKAVYATEFQKEDKKVISDFFHWFSNAGLMRVVNVTHKANVITKAGLELHKIDITKEVPDRKIEFDLIESSEEVERVLDQYTIKEEADILVLLSKNKNFFERVFLKSISGRLVYFAGYPVLVFKD